MTPQVLELAATLARRREPFVLATVVWHRGPSSGKQGSSAVILRDGSIRGWLGGACAEPTVVRESLSALDSGEPRLLFMGPTGERVLPESARQVPMACASEGALEVYLEPMLPPPHVVVIGRSPAVDTLAALALALGWGATIVDEGGIGIGHPEGVDMVTTLDLTTLAVDARTWVVVATQGHYDEDALQAAVATDAGYVGLVASRRRAEEVLGLLRERGVSPEVLERVRAPAGIDLGSTEHAEMAVAILAELVALRASGELDRSLPAETAAAALTSSNGAVDPVCHMTVDVTSTHHRAEYGGQTFYFCAAACREQFISDPGRYVSAST